LEAKNLICAVEILKTPEYSPFFADKVFNGMYQLKVDGIKIQESDFSRAQEEYFMNPKRRSRLSLRGNKLSSIKICLL